ncbi:MAG: hypothetical protein XD50_1373 [Clostridia bacterium 41_269]|nr:MAG: hypothetical protein XD50_1373 [Clostridia bacterium 41_269]
MVEKREEEIEKKAREHVADKFQENSAKNPDDFEVKEQE